MSDGGKSQEGAARGLRADAVRNRERVLEAARTTFAEEGLSVPIDEIARRAGVGAGTVYRHFPTKESLFEAVLLSTIQQLSERAETIAREEDAGEAFFSFFAELLEQAAASKALLEALAGAGVDVETAVGGAGRQLDDKLANLFRRAQRAGAVRTDLSRKELKALMVGALAMQAGTASSRALLVSVLSDGLRATEGAASPV